MIPIAKRLTASMSLLHTQVHGARDTGVSFGTVWDIPECHHSEAQRHIGWTGLRAESGASGPNAVTLRGMQAYGPGGSAEEFLGPKEISN